IKTRFAPSPTGALHIGGVRTAIFNWLYARHNKGKFVLRIEDTDQQRSTEESVSEIYAGLKWIGLDWDEEPVRQSSNLTTYKEYSDKLISDGKAYRCYCTPEQIEQRRIEYKEKNLPYRYEGTCRNLDKAVSQKSFAVRLKTPENGLVEINDKLRGVINYDLKEIDDFVIIKRDGFPTYNFAAVVDDNSMGITDIIRGDDHLSNTPKQVLIYDLLNFQKPNFAHVSMILGQDKSKLSKRHGAISILSYRDTGYLPQAMLNFLVRLGWSHGDQEIFAIDQLVDLFNLQNLGKTPAVFNKEKLLWLNTHYIKNLPIETVAKHTIPFFEKNSIDIGDDKNKFNNVLNVFRERVQTLDEYPQKSVYFFNEVNEYEEKAEKKFLNEDTLPILEKIKLELSALDSFEGDSLHKIFEDIISDLDMKFGKIAQPLRVCLTGGTVSPGIFEVIELLGKQTTLKRLENAINHIKKNN
ncbi:MAG: glutamate--tRNA ligase, partial [Thermodesulfobacteriota bacterium]